MRFALRSVRSTVHSSAVSAGRPRVLAIFLALAIFSIYSLYSYFQYLHFLTPSWDLGIFSQLSKAYAQGNVPIVPIKGHEFNLWGDHFHPILILLTPFYYFFPSPATLLYVQNGLVAISVYFFCRFAQRVGGNVAAVLLTLAYSLSFGVQQAISVQFHEVAFALPFLVLSLGNIMLAKDADYPTLYLRRAVGWALPLVFVKEDMGITVAMIGVVCLLRTGWIRTAWNILFPLQSEQEQGFVLRIQNCWRSWIRTGAVLESTLTIVWGIGWSLLAITVILPYFNTSGQFDYADKVDIVGVLSDPYQSLASLFFPWTKVASLLLLLATGAVLWCLSPLALVALPTLLWRFLSPNEGYWESTWHYSLVLMPVVFLALLDIFKSPPRFLRFIFARSPRRVITLLSALAFAVTVVYLPTQPLKELANPYFASFHQTAVDEAKQQAIDSIPDGTVVASDLAILTYLVPEHKVYWIGHQGKPAPDYVVIDTRGNSWGDNPPENPDQYATERYQASYVVNKKFGSVYVLKKVSADSKR